MNHPTSRSLADLDWFYLPFIRFILMINKSWKSENVSTNRFWTIGCPARRSKCSYESSHTYGPELKTDRCAKYNVDPINGWKSQKKWTLCLNVRIIIVIDPYWLYRRHDSGGRLHGRAKSTPLRCADVIAHSHRHYLTLTPHPRRSDRCAYLFINVFDSWRISPCTELARLKTSDYTDWASTKFHCDSIDDRFNKTTAAVVAVVCWFSSTPRRERAHAYITHYNIV